MNRYVTLALVLIALLIAAFVLFVEPHFESVRDRQLAAGFILDFSIADITGLTLVNGTQTVELEKKDGRWKLTNPIQDDASEQAVLRILQAAQNLRSIDHITANEIRRSDLHLKHFGLYSPKQWIDLKGDQNPRVIFGREAAGTNRIYAGIGEKEDVYVVPDSLRDLALAPVDSLRAQELSTLRLSEIGSFFLRRPSGELEVHREGDRWVLTKPLRGDADKAQVEKLLSGFIAAPISDFVPDGTSNLAAYGITEGENELIVFRRGEKRGEKIRFGRMVDDSKERMYAQSVDRNIVAEVPANVLELLAAATPDNLRDRKLLHTELDVIDRITWDQGGQESVLRRKGEHWVLDTGKQEHEITAKSVESFIQTLEEKTIASFHEATDAELELCGLLPPAGTLKLAAWLSENSAEENAGEKVITTLDFGQSESGRQFARKDQAPEALALNDDVFAVVEAFFSAPARPEPPHGAEGKEDRDADPAI